MIILERMLIIYEYPNYKKEFYTIYEHQCLVHYLRTRGIMLPVEQQYKCKFKSIHKEKVN